MILSEKLCELCKSNKLTADGKCSGCGELQSLCYCRRSGSGAGGGGGFGTREMYYPPL